MHWKNFVRAFLLLFVAASLVAAVVNGRRGGVATTGENGRPEQAQAVVVYCFHGNVRCADCNKIEQYAHDAIQKNFADELRQGRLVWCVLNFEQPENQHFIDEFGIISSCIVVADERNARRAEPKNLQQEVWGFVKANDRAGFATCVEEEVRAMLANQPFARNPE